jgi:hypothetical protein
MAIPAQGCVITWQPWPSGSLATLQEVQELDVRLEAARIDWGGAPYFFRSGELTLTGFSNAALPSKKVTDWGTIKITVPTSGGSLVLHEGYAQFLSSSTRAIVNGAVLFAFQFRLWGVFDTTGTVT